MPPSGPPDIAVRSLVRFGCDPFELLVIKAHAYGASVADTGRKDHGDQAVCPGSNPHKGVFFLRSGVISLMGNGSPGTPRSPR